MKWFERLATYLNKKGRRRMIKRDGEDYLERFYIFSSKRLGIYLHRFWADDDPMLHDHPWHSISILIHGRYFETIPANRDNPFGQVHTLTRGPLKPIMFWRRAQDCHWITLPKWQKPGETWSIFVRFNRIRKWGFYKDGKFELAKVQSRKDL